VGLVNIQITNFENGLNNRNAADLFGSMAQLDPTRFHNYMEDFDYFLAADWTITGAGAGSQDLLNGQGGLLELITAGSSGDAEELTKTRSFGFIPSTPIYFRSRVLLVEAVTDAIWAGISSVAGLQPLNGFVFESPVGSDEVSIFARSGGNTTASAIDIFRAVDNEFFTCEFYWDGISRVYYGINGNPLGFLDLLVGGTAEVPQFNQAISFGVEAGAAQIAVADFDFISCSQERT